jgi:hypothetical protein
MRVRQRGSSSPFWRFVTGTVRSQNLVVLRDNSKLFVNAGVQPYFDFRITYDDVRGTIVLDH